jgi:hypothetical protein
LQKRYENSLKDLLEAVAFEGFARVPKWKITRWFGQSNFTIAIRRNIRERWNSLITDELEWTDPPKLRIAEIHDRRDIILMKDSDFWEDTE